MTKKDNIIYIYICIHKYLAFMKHSKIVLYCIYWGNVRVCSIHARIITRCIVRTCLNMSYVIDKCLHQSKCGKWELHSHPMINACNWDAPRFKFILLLLALLLEVLELLKKFIDSSRRSTSLRSNNVSINDVTFWYGTSCQRAWEWDRRRVFEEFAAQLKTPVSSQI